VLLLDEPASGLDPIVRREVLLSLIDALTGEGRTVLLSSHLMEDVERLADRLAFLDAGRIVLEGDAEEIRGRARRVTVGPLPHGVDLGPVPGRPQVERRGERAVLTYLEGAEEAARHIRKTGRFTQVDVTGMNLEELYVDLLAKQKEVASCAV
jgi:ABC-2 type transport system ATP-binding protein